MRRQNGRARPHSCEKNDDISRLTVLGRPRYQEQTNEDEQLQDFHPGFCRFFALHGNCRFGDDCAYSHDIPDGMSMEEVKKHIPCPFYARGNCRYGEYCQLRHLPNDLCKRSAQASKKKSAHQISDSFAEPLLESKNILTCGICLDNLPSSPPNSAPLRQQRKFGLLSCCNHVFCFDCLMEWRKEGSEDASDRRSCPTCRKHSEYVVPSTVFPSSDDEKEVLIQEYKDRLAIIPCRRFNGRFGSCPFGSNCFYAHCDMDGADVKALDKSMQLIRQERERQRERGHLNAAGRDALSSLGILLDREVISEVEAFVALMQYFDSSDVPFNRHSTYWSDDDSSMEGPSFGWANEMGT